VTSFSPDAGTEIGSLIAGKYRVDSMIGEGGMGKVLRATHMELERIVAIKVIRGDLAASSEVAARMLLEARAAASITNEHVVRVLDVGRMEGGAPFIVMEHLSGKNLYGIVQERGPLPVWQAVDWLLEACEALAEAHALGIVHRDMKPENLFLASRADGTPTIKVLDFGVSKRTSDGTTRHGPMALTNPSTAVGSPHYMAPEQMRARGDVDGRADIYSLGAILFELLTGRPPFDADNIPTLCTMVLSDDPPTLMAVRTGLPAELDAVIQRCLRKNPDERFWSVSEFARAIAPFGSQEARASVDRVIRVLGDSPPPASQRSYQVSVVNPAAQTLTMPARSETPTPVTSSETVKPTEKSNRVLVALGLTLVSLAGIAALFVVWRMSQAGADKPLQRALAAATLPSPKPLAPVESLAAPAPTIAPSAASPDPVAVPTKLVPRPPREPKPPPTGTSSDTFGGRK
jgi:serine/threonine-protein kinase